MTGYRVLAVLRLRSTEEGGLAAPLPSGTPSLLLRFPPAEPGGESVTLGAVLTPHGGVQVLAAGHEIHVDVLFWADEARVYATVGASFDIWYGRLVGSGVILNHVDEPVG